MPILTNAAVSFGRKKMKSAANRGTALVLGVANGRSIAWHCANALLNKGYDVIVTYQNDRFRPQVEKLVETKRHELLKQSSHRGEIAPSVGENRTTVTTGFQLKFTPTIHCLACDVASDESIENLFDNDLPLLLEALNAKQRGDEEEEHNNNNNDNGPLLNAVVHSIAYAPPDAMKDGSLLTTSRESFRIAHDISAYSLIAIARHALPFLRPPSPPQSSPSSSPSLDTMHQEESRKKPADDSSSSSLSSPFLSSSSITALSYLGAATAIPNYNIMGPAKASLEAIVRGLALELGSCPLAASATSLSPTIQQKQSQQQQRHYSIRVNCVSAGPLNTMASRGIRNFTAMKLDSECKSPLRRNVTSEEVAEMVAFLAMGDAAGASGITGQTIYVDGGYSSVNGPI